MLSVIKSPRRFRPFPPDTAPPARARQRGAFSLVLSLTVMAMLLILCVGAAALLSVELRVAQSSVARSRARLNAMVGARIAFGELQRLMGPDQRVSATAEILCNPQGTDPTQALYYSNPTSGTVTHPHWVGVWNTGRTDDDAAPVGAIPSQTKKVIYRTTDGTLKDSRFSALTTGSGGTDAWTTARAGITVNRSSKRLLGWPGGKPQHLGEGQGAPGEWKEMLEVWHIKQGDNDAVLKVSPLSKLEAPAKAKIPLLVVYGDADKVVPSKENSEPLIQKYRTLGGTVESIVRKGGDHHPHGLESVQPDGVKPVVAFFEKALAAKLASPK